MCGIAGIIYRQRSGPIGADLARMLQAMKHRGPDSTGYALYGEPGDLLVMRFTLADPNDPRDFSFSERLARNVREVEARLAKIGATIDRVDGESEYAYRASFRYDGELKPLADYVEDVPGAEVLMHRTRPADLAVVGRRWRKARLAAALYGLSTNLSKARSRAGSPLSRSLTDTRGRSTR